MKVTLITEDKIFEERFRTMADGLGTVTKVNTFAQSEGSISNKDFKSNLFIIEDQSFTKFNLKDKSQVFTWLIENEIPAILVLEDQERVSEYSGLKVIDYFTSPMDWKRLELRIDSIHVVSNGENANKKSDKFILKYKKEVILVDYDDIFFFEKNGRKLSIHMKERVLTIYESLKNLQNILPVDFVRVHNSYTINSKKIARITEVGNRSFEIEFHEYDKAAKMSRYKSDNLLKEYLTTSMRAQAL